jgi:hypothetical protein
MKLCKTVEKTCKAICGSGFQLRRSGSGRASVPAVAEFLDHLLIEGRNVVRSSARDQAVVHDDFFIDPIRARVPDISLDRGPGSDGPAADNACVDQDSGGVADRGDRFCPRERNGARTRAPLRTAAE